MRTSRSSKSQHGAALIIGLLLVAVASLGAITSMRGTLLQDRMVSNQQNKIISQMAAEAGAGRFLEWLSDSGRSNTDELSSDWKNTDKRKHPATKKVIHVDAQTGSNQFPPFGHYYIPKEPDWGKEGEIPVTIVGISRSGSEILAETQLQLSIRLDGSSVFEPSPAPPAALTLGGKVTGFSAANSNPFKITGGDDNVAVATDQNFSDGDSLVKREIPKNRTGNYTGGGLATPSVTAMDLGLPWSNAMELKKLVDHAETRMPNQTAYNAGDGTFDLSSVNIGSSGSEMVTVVRGNAEIKGNKAGAGILIVTGDLTWSGTPDFKGLVVVLGGDLTWNGGGNGGVRGSIYIANIDQSDPANWSFDSSSGTRFNGGGNASLVYDKTLLTNTLNGLGKGGGGPGGQSVKVLSWASY
ncbi:PilX N-terminal domain-containing pilus assembly protein [Thiocapsa sp.]|uniref:pilus assembly PilX family protein n=1 Tax=Thiocapsa sp. TaxID=2024551 RepID=UPI001BCDAC97|nr:pilus assembly PilX N-terminal domain-containing protein [Thiocapsa sp.]